MIPVRPMLLTPTSTLRGLDDEWIFTVKYDGYRAIVEVGTSVRIWTRQGVYISDWYPELQAFRDVVATSGLFDCELVALDENGRAQFDWMRRPEKPKTLYVFDALRRGAQWLLDEPLGDRLQHLDQMVPAVTDVSLRAAIFHDGEALLAQCELLKLEGVCAKRLGSRYQQGRRSRDWLKLHTECGRQTLAMRGSNWRNRSTTN